MIELMVPQRRRDLGGFEVGRVLPAAQRRMVGSFVFFDHMGPVDFAPGIPREVDVRPHPHIGLSTVSYLFDGEIMHRDSVGSQQAIRPGEVNWMTAGSGITHSERFERARREGGRMHGIQAWVALPDGEEEIAPAFAHHEAAELPAFEVQGANGRLIAGAAFGRRSPVQTHSPMFYLHWQMAAGSRIELPADQLERAAYVATGTIETEGQSFAAGQMAIFVPGGSPVIRALEPAIVMLLGGESVGPRYLEWNFVSSSQDRIEQAKADWRAGRMKLPDHDNAEFIPLPEPAPAPNPMS
ncbi:MAG: pirin family protein [Novosphingobium sp.]